MKEVEQRIGEDREEKKNDEINKNRRETQVEEGEKCPINRR